MEPAQVGGGTMANTGMDCLSNLVKRANVCIG